MSIIKQKNDTKKKYFYRESLYDPNKGFQSVFGSKIYPISWTYYLGLTHTEKMQTFLHTDKILLHSVENKSYQKNINVFLIV